jgi:glutamate/tyrosine decarboxylase-like PLP-dependent enzyme
MEAARNVGEASLNFALDSAARRALGYKLIDQIDRYFASLHELPVQLPLEQRTFEPLRNPLPEVGSDAERILDDICSQMIAQGFHVPSGNYFGLMNPAPTYIGVLAEALVAALNPQLASMARSQLASKIEQETVRWIGERVYGPAHSELGWRDGEFYGTFTAGGNEANFSALAAALAHRFPEAIENGVATIGAQPVVYASSEAHHSLDKSCGLLGIGRRALRRVPVTDRIQLDVRQLEAAIKEDAGAGRSPFCVVATAGTTNSGAIDDIAAIGYQYTRAALAQWQRGSGAVGQ